MLDVIRVQLLKYAIVNNTIINVIEYAKLSNTDTYIMLNAISTSISDITCDTTAYNTYKPKSAY